MPKGMASDLRQIPSALNRGEATNLSFGVLATQIDTLDAAPDSAAVLGQLGPRVKHQLEEREEGLELLAVALAELGVQVGVELALGRVERERPRLVSIEAMGVVQRLWVDGIGYNR